MTSEAQMRLERIVLENYHGFERLDMELPAGKLCVLIGRNGSGKSSILDGITVGLDAVRMKLLTPEDPNPDWRFEPIDIRTGSSQLSISLYSDLGAIRCTYDSADEPGVSVEEDEVTPPLREQLPRLGAKLPLLLSLKAGRTTSHADPEPYEDFEPDHRILSAWLNALQSGNIPFTNLVPWFTHQENIENEQRLRHNPDFKVYSLEVVRRALVRFLAWLPGGGYTSPHIRRLDPFGKPLDPGVLVFEKDGAPYQLDQLSDGEQMMLMLVGDIARRLFIANANAPDPLAGAGVVLIDEIELHLHPSWQQIVLPALTATFPGLQFIVATHSPHVLASVPGDAVRILEGFQAHRAPPTWGRDANSILRGVMGSSERPAETRDALRQIAGLLDDEKLDDARAALDALAQKLTGEDEDLQHLRATLAFLEE